MSRGGVEGNVSSSGKITLWQWKDKRVVTLLSNFINPRQMMTRRRKQKGERETEVIDVPAMVRVYNYDMGEVDLADQLKECYQVDHSSKYKYCLRLLFDMLDMSLCNSSTVLLTKTPNFPQRNSDESL